MRLYESLLMHLRRTLTDASKQLKFEDIDVDVLVLFHSNDPNAIDVIRKGSGKIGRLNYTT